MSKLSQPMNEIKWIAVPGGPGLSKDYLEIGLQQTIPDWPLTFYEPLGSAKLKSKPFPSIQDMVTQINSVATDNKLKQYGLVAHSFGSYLAIKACLAFPEQVKAMIFIGPMPLTFTAWRNAQQAMQERLPETILQQLSQQKINSNQLFKALLPYYMHKNIELEFDIDFDLAACQEISAQVEDYDHQNFLKNTSIPWVSIIGDKDPFFDSNLINNRQIVLTDVGHYPFFEDIEGFQKAMHQASCFIDKSRL